MGASGVGPVLVSGATGLVGGRLVAALRRDGLAVRALTRDPAAGTRRLGAGVAAVAWDGIRPPPAALAGAGAVVHLAGEPLFAGRLTAARRRRIVASRVESTRALVAVIEALPARERPGALVCASAVGFYGSRGDEVLDEDAAPGRGFLADLCRAWEEAAAAAPVRSTSLRIGIALAREGGALPRLALRFRFGLGGRLGDGRQWFPWVHVDDLVAAIRTALADEAISGPLNAVAPEPVRNAELTATLARLLRRPALLAVPAFALRAALGELAEELLASRRVAPRRLLERGFRFAWPTLEAALATELRPGAPAGEVPPRSSAR